MGAVGAALQHGVAPGPPNQGNVSGAVNPAPQGNVMN